MTPIWGLRQNGRIRRLVSAKDASNTCVHVITLIPKKNKDETLLDNWIPISLMIMNTDYKIATRAIASRISKILPDIIHSDQAGFVKKRFIGQNIRLISDVFERCHDTKTTHIALFLDFKKAFDSIEWSFLFKALETFGFGDMLVEWIKTFYTNPLSGATNNGFATPFFSLRRLTPRCPLFGILFVFGVEFLSCNIRSDKSGRLTQKNLNHPSMLMTLLALLKILHLPSICLKNWIF